MGEARVTTTDHGPTVDFEPLDPSIADEYNEVTAAIREQCPVMWSTGHWAPDKTGFWLLTGYEQVVGATLDSKRFISGEGAVPVQYPLDLVRMIPLEVDEPLHKQIRLQINPFFVSTAIDEVEADIQRMIDELLEKCLAQDPCEMISSFATVLPPRAFFELFLNEDPKKLHDILEIVEFMQLHPERTSEIAAEIYAWCAELLETARQEGRRDDLIGTIAHMGLEPDGELVLTETERIQMMHLQILAGVATTQTSLGGMFYAIAADPALRERIAGLDDTQLAHAVEEFLRFISPVGLAGRTVVEDVEMAGCPIAAGDRTTLSWAGANHDPAMFPEPNTIDVARPNAKRHVAFGSGIHLCIGKDLARRELRLALRAVSQLSRFELADGFTPRYPAAFVRGPIRLPIHLAR